MKKLSLALICAALSVAMLATLTPTAGAFKPYTHAKTGEAVLIDVADGDVTIFGKEYPVNQAVVDALTNHEDFYNAGVIGPDGFPDLTFGQSVIHPEDTGLWLRHIFDRAWAAQTDGGYNATERSQILAFAYGYLMHAAGDTWAHTFVNDFAQGTFPGPSEILTDAQKASIALRHLIVEGYIGDATEGYDGNVERGPAPGGDVSDDSTPGIDFPTAAEFGGVKRFIYNTLISPTAGAPTAERGPVIGFFQGLRSQLATAVDDWDPQPLETLLGAWESAKDRYDNIDEKVDTLNAAVAKMDACAIEDLSCSKTFIFFGEVVPAAADVGFTITLDTLGAIGDLIAGAVTAAFEAIGAALDAVLDAYLVAWIEDIDTGLQNWAEFGRATTVALFDPQARRDLQNEECADEGTEYDQNRIDCEDGIGFTSVLFDQADPFINDHLLSMLGAPDFVGGLREALQSLSDAISDLLEPIGVFFNPLEEVLADVKKFATDKLKELIQDTIGVDLELLHSFMTEPTSWMDVEQIGLTLPAPLGFVGLDLFEPDDHERLDGYLGFEGTDHLEPAAKPWPDFPLAAGVRLKDDATFTDLAPFDNAVTLGKLLLLDGPTLDQVISDRIGRPYSLYGSQPNANIMLNPLPGAGTSTAMWLSSIDADHAWRSDAQPTFPGTPSGGQGNFPLWESCALRDDVFRGLFQDWQNGDANFPDLGDEESFDPNDPFAPTSTLVVGGTTYTAGGTTYLGGASTLTLETQDDFWRDDEIDVAVEVTDHTGTVTTTQLGDGDQVDLTALADGPVQIELTATDPCRTEVPHTESFVIDTTPPVVTYSSPAPDGRIFDTDDFSSIAWTTDDGVYGSGVASQSMTFDGVTRPHGYGLDMFFLQPGTHTIVVTAADNLGNSGTTTRTFVVRATADSLASNVQRAYSLGLITKANVRDSLADKIATARKAHNSGKHPTEHNALGAFVEAILAQRGKAIDPATANRFIAYATDLVANGG